MVQKPWLNEKRGRSSSQYSNQWFRKLQLGCKNRDYQTRLGRYKTVDSEVVLQDIQASIMRVRYLTVQCGSTPSQHRQIRKVAFREYQASSLSYSPVWFDAFTTSANPKSSIQRVSGEFGILQSSVVRHLHNIGKSGK